MADTSGVPTNVATVDVRLVDVVKRFGETVAVDHIDLEVLDGEFFSLLGPSGCGKTTTLRMIGGFEEPTSGLIELQGEDVTWLPPFKRNVNTVFQNYALFPHLTIYENVAFGLRRRGVPDRDVKGRVGEMLELVELPGYERRSAWRSRGRSSIARPSSCSTNRSARSTSSSASRCRWSSSASSRKSGSRSST
jgi:spermidine/putrescine transport system ATP-binding protein